VKTKQLIVRFLDLRQGTTIAGHTLQIEVPLFKLTVYGGKPVNPATVDRVWRDLRTVGNTYLEQNGYAVTEDTEHRGKEKQYIIRRLVNEIHRDSERKATEQRDDNFVNRSQEPSSEGTRIIP